MACLARRRNHHRQQGWARHRLARGEPCRRTYLEIGLSVKKSLLYNVVVHVHSD